MIRTLRTVVLVLTLSLLAAACYSAGGEDAGPTASVVTLDGDDSGATAPDDTADAAEDGGAEPAPEATDEPIQVDLTDEVLPTPDLPTVQTDLSDPAGLIASVGPDELLVAEFQEMAADWAPLWEARQGLPTQNADGVIEAGFGGFVVGQWVQSQVYLDLAEDLGVEPTDDDRANAVELMTAQLPELVVESFGGTLFRDVQAVISATTPTDEERQAYYDENIDSFGSTLCSAHILVDTEAEAQAAFERATTGGEDFAALAVELSTGPSGPSGGDLGCTDPAGFVPEFSDEALTATEPDEVVGPVETQFGWHVILVRSIGAPDFDAVVADIDAALTAPLTQQFQQMLIDADVTVDAGVGTWDPIQGQVIANL